MNLPDPSQSSASINEEASRWVMRLDRGLTPAEQDNYFQWLAADRRCGEAMARLGHTWNSFDRLAGFQSAVEPVTDPDLLRPRKRNRKLRIGWALWAATPLAAAMIFVISFSPRQEVQSPEPQPVAVAQPETTPPAPIEERTLEDGSLLRLNRGAVVTVEYSTAERRLRLERGEAAFKVTKNPERPFVVMTAGVVVRALGTEFNVHLGDRAVDVIVTEGSVAIANDAMPAAETAPTIAAGQRATVALVPVAAAPVVTTPLPEELSRRLAWQPRLLTFNDEPLSMILGEFNRHNPVTLRIDDAALQDLRLSARFRSDNVQGFLRLLESEFRVRSEPRANGEIVLRGLR